MFFLTFIFFLVRVMKKNDLKMVILVILMVVLVLCTKKLIAKPGNYAIIYINGEKYKQLDLSENIEIYVNETNIVKTENGYVYMKSATCPDRLCIKQGKINTTDKTIVCLPNKITVKIEN